MNNPYAGKNATLQDAWQRGFEGKSLYLMHHLAEEVERAYREGQALRATYAMPGRTPLGHPRVTGGVR